VTPTEGCPYIELDAGWTEPERRIDQGRRRDFRRALRHAEELGNVTFEVLAPDPAELPGLLAEAWAVGAPGWQSANLGIFYRRFAADACRQGRLRLGFMRIGARAVAMQFATECAERFWLHKTGHDAAFGRCAPGILLMLHTLRYAAQRGLRSYELLGPPASWREFWTPSVRPCVALRAYPPTTHSLVTLCADSAAAGWRWLKRRLRPGA
jgi:CelD/BcsL family acetyltransferase involved in cellulose biosynthesis